MEMTNHEKGVLSLFRSMLETAERDARDLDQIARGMGQRMFGETIRSLRARIDRIEGRATARAYDGEHDRAASRINKDMMDMPVAGNGSKAESR